MAKVQIKSEKLTPFGGFFSIMKQFDALLAQTIDSTLGLRCTMFEPTLKSKACFKYLYFTKIISDLCRNLECFSYLYTINQTE